jgi:hypothetical protein
MRTRDSSSPHPSRYAGLRLASGVQLKYFLRYHRLPAGMNDGRAKVIERVLGYVASGKLAGETVDRAIVEFLEYRNKRVYLFQADLATLERTRDSTFSRRIESWAEARIEAQPDLPRQNYAYVDSRHIRITFSETHRHPAIRLAEERVGWRRVGKVIVLDVDRPSGFVTLSHDPPGRIHPHGRRPLDYFAHYRAKAEELLGGPLSPFPLHRALVELESGDLVRIQQGRGSTLDGRVDIVALGFDVRTMPVFQAVKPSIALRDSGRYVWLPGGQPGNGGPHLLREIPTDIYATTSMVRFTRDSLVQEVRYVLEQIQAHA